MKTFDFAYDYARDARTALSWLSIEDRARIAENLRSGADVVAAEMVHAKSAEERKYFYRQVERIYTRLAVCDLLVARDAEVKLEHEAQEQAWVRSVLKGMAQLVDMACLNADHRRDNFAEAQKSALRLQLLRDVFPDGREGRLLKLSKTVAEMDVELAMEKYGAIYEVNKMAKGFEDDTSVEAESMSDDIFTMGHKLLRRELGLDKESGRA